MVLDITGYLFFFLSNLLKCYHKQRFYGKSKAVQIFLVQCILLENKVILLKLSGDIHNIIKGHFIAILSDGELTF